MIIDDLKKEVERQEEKDEISSKDPELSTFPDDSTEEGSHKLTKKEVARLFRQATI